MREQEAKRIGSRQALISVTIGVLIAQSIMTYFGYFSDGFVNAFLWFTTISYKLNLFVGIVIMFLCGHFFGQIAGNLIIIKKVNAVLVGCLCGLAVLITTAFLCGWTGFLQEGLDNIGTEDDPFFDYLYKPFFWIMFFGAIPALLVGIWFGKQIRRKGANYFLSFKDTL